LTLEGVNQTSDNLQQHSLAMATNEFLHLWIRNDANNDHSKFRIFGTILISLTKEFLSLHRNGLSVSPIKFKLLNAGRVRTVVPRKDLLTCEGSNDLDYFFVIDTESLCKFISRQQIQRGPYYPIDLARYDVDTNGIIPPLSFFSCCQKIGNEATEIRISYSMNADTRESPLSQLKVLDDVVFKTKISRNDSTELSLSSSQPPAQWLSKEDALVWKVPSINACFGSGVLKAVLAHPIGLSPLPTNTYVNFQIPDFSVTNTVIQLENEGIYKLSLFKKKIIAGEYFYEQTDAQQPQT